MSCCCNTKQMLLGVFCRKGKTLIPKIKEIVKKNNTTAGGIRVSDNHKIWRILKAPPVVNPWVYIYRYYIIDLKEGL